MKLRLANLLLLTLIQGEIIAIFSIPSIKDENIAVISNSNAHDEENKGSVADSITAYLPSQEDEGIVNVKNRRSVRKRSTGRAVNIPAEAVERMAQTPLSALSTDLPAIQQLILDTHNKYRSLAVPTAKNMLKMVWNAEAAKTALEYAKKCQVGHSPQNEREITNFKCGENIFLSKFKVPWDTVVDAWHSECIDYKYGFGAISDQEVGHYTQMMWATSYAMGCAIHECSTDSFKYIYVCHCCPSGNKGSRLFPWKEGNSCEDCPNKCENKLCTNPCSYQDWFKNCPDFNSNCESDRSMDKNCPATCQCKQGEIK